ncbi:hypothetical protein [Rickettsia rhipicephali]|uniref:hypothetical protein n=1 Tax=Rickettsia rhipicephali TaxID=33992 RepID=UPI000A45B0E2|nr:hypothetical protein [Rickettsia rhipicephali]
MPSSYENEFNIVKKAHLNFINYLNSLEQSLTRIEKATDKYNEDHKIASWLTEKSALVSNHSGKIAITYVSLIVGVIALRSYVIDEKDPWYELCALPTTNLAMQGHILIKLTLIACLFSFLGALILYAYTT